MQTLTRAGARACVLGVVVITIAACASAAPAEETASVQNAWVQCISSAVRRLDDGKTDPVSIAYGIEPQCAVQFEKIIQTASEGMMTSKGQAEARRIYTVGELHLVTSAILSFRAAHPRGTATAAITEPAYTPALQAYGRKDYQTAAVLARPLANQGDAVAQTLLGAMYEAGEGIPKNYTEAIKWFGEAAQGGQARAQTLLAVMYSNGQGVAKDDAEAAKWFRKAAEQGDAKAEYELGVIYSSGQGAPKDLAEAVQWYRMAAEQGAPEAETALGDAYYHGTGVPQDYIQAAKWFGKAAEQGSALAQFALGGMYCFGNGVPPDFAQAYKWLSLAMSDNGMSRDAEELRARLEAKMTPTQIAESKNRVNEWKPVSKNITAERSSTSIATRDSQSPAAVSAADEKSEYARPLPVCSKADRELAQLARENGYQYNSTCN